MKFVIKLGYYDRVEGIGGADRYIGHDEDKRMLLDVPWTRVETELDTAKEGRKAINGDWEAI